MKKVITYGTFDLFHQGHYNIIKRAKAYGDYLIVGVTSESYDIERGKLSVHDSLLTRIENVKKTGLVDEIIVEEYLGQKTRDIIQYDIDTLSSATRRLIWIFLPIIPFYWIPLSACWAQIAPAAIPPAQFPWSKPSRSNTVFKLPAPTKAILSSPSPGGKTARLSASVPMWIRWG